MMVSNDTVMAMLVLEHRPIARVAFVDEDGRDVPVVSDILLHRADVVHNGHTTVSYDVNFP